MASSQSVNFQESHEPCFSTAQIQGVLPSRDDMDSGIVRLSFWSYKEADIELPPGAPSKTATPFVVAVECVMTRRGLASLLTELELVFDADVPKNKKGEIKKIVDAERGRPPIALFKHGKAFRRLFANGVDARATDDGVRIVPWHRKIRVETGGYPTIISFVEAELLVSWHNAAEILGALRAWAAREGFAIPHPA